MQTPVWSSEPIPAEPIRTVDLFPAMLDWLGEPVPSGLDAEAVWRPAGNAFVIPGAARDLADALSDTPSLRSGSE
jgi:hypothetical protein